MTYDVVQSATFEGTTIKAKGSKGIQMSLKDQDIDRIRTDYPNLLRVPLKMLAYKLKGLIVDFSSLNGEDKRTKEEFIKETKKGQSMAKNEKYHMKLVGVGSKKLHEVKALFMEIRDQYIEQNLQDFGKSFRGLEDCKKEEEKDDVTIVFKCEPSFVSKDCFDNHINKLEQLLVEKGVCTEIKESKKLA